MYKKIMVPLDGSKLAECVLPHVDGFVTGCQVETIIFVRVIEPTPPRFSATGSTVNPQNYETVRINVERIEEESRSSAERYLKEVISRVKQDGIKYKVDVLIATHGRSGISRWVRGSIADKVLRSSRAPVLMVRADDKMSGEKV
jgi:nucleotide-binding universal stress UspA family protein